jgi:hypothetical protein
MTSVASVLCTLIVSAVFNVQDLGPHNINGQGCLACHNSNYVDPSNVADTYLWGNFAADASQTSGGGALTAGPEQADQDPGSHSATCLGCHDGGIAEGASTSGGSVLHDHPVNVPYALGKDGHWPGTVTASGVSFTPGHFDLVYGRPVRFYVSSGTPYVECSSCHDPHHYSAATMTIGGQTVTRPTRNFVRGWYDDSNSTHTSVSQFCRSCHYDMSNESDGLNIPTT